MNKEDMIQFEDTLSSIVINAKKLWQESRSALQDYEAEQIVFPYNVVDRCNLIAKHVEKLKPYCNREDEQEDDS